MPDGLNDPAGLRDDIRRWLREDLGRGDVTTVATVGSDTVASARILSKEPLVLAGTLAAGIVFQEVAPPVNYRFLLQDGDKAEVGSDIALISGPVRGILAGERLALNLLQHLSGIATLTRKFVEAVEGTGVRILDTRKTTPGLRMLEKAAVRAGGGENHRFGLDDGILIKENHITAAGGIVQAVNRARRAARLLRVEVEVRSSEEVREALTAGADLILLDNMETEGLREAVSIVGGKIPLEASGNVRLETVRAIAETGVDFISTGAITHSAPAADLSLLIQKE